MNGDGSCLFTSVAATLISRVQNSDAAVLQMLLRLGVPEANLKDINYILRLLRTRMVEECHNNIEY